VTHAGFNVERAQAPRRIEQQGHVLRKEGFGGVAAVVLPRVNEHKILEFDFQLSHFSGTLNPLLAASNPMVTMRSHGSNDLGRDHNASFLHLQHNANDVVELRPILQAGNFDVATGFYRLVHAFRILLTGF
jgi:hypothetical protein